MHDATKQVLGVTGSNHKDVSVHAVDPASFPAGRKVCMASTGLPSLLKSAGFPMGVTLGKSLSDTKKIAVVRTGLAVPVELEYTKANGIVTITSYANLVSGTDDAITVGATVFTAQAGAATPGDATFQAVTNNNTTAASLAAQINAHAVAGALVTATVSNAIVTITAQDGGVGGNDIALTYTDNDSNVGATVTGVTSNKLDGGAASVDYVTIGAKAYFNDFTGKADSSAADTTVSDAVYVSGALTGVKEDGTTTLVALVDMPGGL